MSGGISATTIAMVAASVVSAGASIVAGQQAKKTGEANAELQRREGESQKDAAVAQAEKIRKAQRQAIGAANAANAASGVAIGEGSALRINEEIYQDSESDAYNTLLTGTRRARSSDEQGSIMRSQGKNAQTAGYLNAGASLLSSGAGMAKGWKSSNTGFGTGSNYGNRDYGESF